MSTAMNARASKAHNRMLIFRGILQNPLSRVELASMVGLTRAAVGVIVDQLIQDGIVREAETKRSPKGRRPVNLEIIPGKLLAAGVDITRDSCRIGISDITGRVAYSASVTLDRAAPPAVQVNTIAVALKGLLSGAGLDDTQLLGIGITTPGPVDADNGVVLEPPNFAPWCSFPVREAFSRRFALPVFLENNALALAAAENSYGWGRELNSFVVLATSGGIGCGIVQHGTLFRGSNGMGSEIGHTCIDRFGAQCYCGNTGCLELYASPDELVKQAATQNRSIRAWSDVDAFAQAGDGDCLALVRQEAEYLSLGLTTAANLLDPQAVILTGALAESPVLREELEQRLNMRRLNRTRFPLRILPSRLPEDASLLAASTLVFEKQFAL